MVRRMVLPGSRPGEGSLLGRVAGTFALIEAGRGVGEVGADTLVTSGPDGAAVLPPLFVALGVAGLGITLGYAAAVTRARGDRFFPGLLLGIAGTVAVAWLAALAAGSAATSLLWVVVMTAGSLLMTVSWTIAGRAFHARQARRLFPVCASAAIAGSFAGQLIAGPVAHAVGPPQLVLLEAVLVLAAAAVLAGIGPQLRSLAMPDRSVARALGEGAAYVARTPLLRLIAVAYVLFAVLLVGVSFGFLREARAAFPDEAQRATALGLFSAVVTAAAFLVSAVVAHRLTARVGVTATALVLPIVYLGGFLLWAAQLTFVTAAGVRFAQVVTQRGVSNAAWSSFFSVVPGHRRAQVLAFIDGVPGQAGTILTGLVLMVGLAGGRDLFLAAALVAAVCLVIVVRIRRAYVTTLVATLRDGAAVRVLIGGPDLASIVADPAVIDGLLADTASADPGRRRLVAGLLAGIEDPRVVRALEHLAGDSDPRVRAAAFRAFPSHATAREVLLAGIEDPDAGVRVAAIGAAGVLDAAHDTDRAAIHGALMRAADDPDPEVRAAVADALATFGETERAIAILQPLLTAEDSAGRLALVPVLARHPTLALDGLASRCDLLDDPAEPVRLAAARSLLDAPGGPSCLVDVVCGGAELSRGAALSALAQGADLEPADRARLLRWTGDRVDRVGSLGAAAASLRASLDAERMASRAGDAADGGAMPLGATEAAEGLVRLLAERARHASDELLAALRALCRPEVGEVIARSMAAADPEARAQAIEALEVVVGGPVARQVAAALDGVAPDSRVRTVRACAEALCDDTDPWVRALALHTLVRSEAPVGDPRDGSLQAKLAGDTTPGVRAEEPVSQVTAESMASSDLLDRMLLLGRVPLFASLAPDDLARIAVTAVAAGYRPDEVLIDEGDTSDHLVVIATGSVRVVTGAPGEERVIRRCGPGEHIGELAMLRRAPRAASVIAEPPGVRALLLDAVGLRSVLQARPSAAMAMLATLAERIGGSER